MNRITKVGNFNKTQFKNELQIITNKVITDKQKEIQIQNYENRHEHENLHGHTKNKQNRAFSSGDVTIHRMSPDGS